MLHKMSNLVAALSLLVSLSYLRKFRLLGLLQTHTNSLLFDDDAVAHHNSWIPHN